ncbi:hypothetical protein LTR86_007028 [Recurvomyces mirabilis]|nr:hypothetical protein LTR86_007028 [Recurvomyces mirabilis]
MDPKSCVLYKLPPELRNRIYDFSFHGKDQGSDEIDLLTAKGPDKALLLTSKAIYDEAKAHVATRSACEAMVQQLPLADLQHIKTCAIAYHDARQDRQDRWSYDQDFHGNWVTQILECSGDTSWRHGFALFCVVHRGSESEGITLQRTSLTNDDAGVEYATVAEAVRYLSTIYARSLPDLT